ncbi:MAG TPA: iron chelate uptake ABC transporter family permease subunit [Acidimicrobiales bacterium]|nr:iron chelate uptake ABC transporter family permease subunit [Acidimicrobiales bacterium]
MAALSLPRPDRRALAVTLVVAAAACGVFAWSISLGDFPVPMGDVVATLLGGGDADSELIVRTLRLPRALTGLLVGAAFGLSGAIFQRVARNPLASPDIVGINAGAAAAVTLIVLFDATSTRVTLGALAGAALTVLAIYLLAYKRGVTGYRFVLVGVGASAMLFAVTQYMLTRAELYDAQRAFVWLTGSLNGRGWDYVRPLTIALAVLVPAALALGRRLRILDLGDDAARGLGVRVEATRTGLLLTAATLAAVATAAAGPVAFVALVSPQVARRLVGGCSAALAPSAAFGALLLVSADLVARRIFAPTELRVGVVTAILGAPYLLFLLARANRIGVAG